MAPIRPHDPFTSTRAPASEENNTANSLYNDGNTVVRQTMTELQQEEANLLQSMGDLQTDLSPFQRLPYDIVSEILLACVDMYPIMDPKYAPLLFLRISRSIRHVALSQPRIWSGIQIIYCGPILQRMMESDKKNGTATATLFIRALKEWLLVRSGDVPLNIKISGALSVSSRDTLGDSILDILIACMRRWRVITFTLVGPRCNEFPFNGADFPCLQYFSFSIGDPLCTSLPKIDFLHAPKLQGLKLRQYARNTMMPLPFLSLPWSKLTYLDLDTIATPVFPMLPQTTSLIHLGMGWIDAEDIGTEQLNCPFLTSIEFKARSSSKAAALLQLLSAPNLTSLKLENKHPVGDDLPSIVQRFPQLAGLHIFVVDLFSFREVLAHTPNLKKLHFSESPRAHNASDNVFLRSFISDDYGPQLCPKLEVFVCRVILLPDEDALRDFFRKKRSSTDGPVAWKFCHIDVMGLGDSDVKIRGLYGRLVDEAKFEYEWPHADDSF